MLTMHPEARRKVVRLLGEVEAEPEARLAARVAASAEPREGMGEKPLLR
jgi:hypothetical protein